MFRGANPVTLDAKGRLAMPTRFREQIVARSNGRLMATVDRSDRCLLIYPLPDWDEIERKLVALPTLNPAARRLQRLMIGHANELELDSLVACSFLPSCANTRFSRQAMDGRASLQLWRAHLHSGGSMVRSRNRRTLPPDLNRCRCNYDELCSYAGASRRSAGGAGCE